MTVNGYATCPGCLRTVRVAKGLICYHVSNHWEKTCKMFKQPAKWAVPRPLDAGGKNPAGECMRCGWSVEDGENPDCIQCCYEKRSENDLV